MIEGLSVLAIIPARGGSKGIPRKNIKMIAGKPLIAWTIEEAKKSKYIDRLITSTEDEEIASIAKSFGCDVPFLRPRELAKDDTPGISPVIHAIETLPQRYNYVMLLQPTSPLRTVADIDRCLQECVRTKASSCVSVVQPDKKPHWMYLRNNDGRLQPLLSELKFVARRQDLPTVYALNGAVYIAKTEWISETKSFISDQTVGFSMEKFSSLDIDDEMDFNICDYLLKERMKNG